MYENYSYTCCQGLSLELVSFAYFGCLHESPAYKQINLLFISIFNLLLTVSHPSSGFRKYTSKVQKWLGLLLRHSKARRGMLFYTPYDLSHITKILVVLHSKYVCRSTMSKYNHFWNGNALNFSL